MRLRTTRCEQAKHPELELELGEADPSLAAGLIDWIETTVAGGTKFEPGETVHYGSAMLQVRARSNRSLSLYEPHPGSQPIVWVDSVADSITAMANQRRAAASVGLEDDLDFPNPMRTAYICTRAKRGARVGLIRNEPMEQDVGWCVMCADHGHDHTSADEIEVTTIYELGLRIPEFRMFQAMPIKTAVLVGGGQPIEVFFDKRKLPLVVGSMLHAINRVVPS